MKYETKKIQIQNAKVVLFKTSIRTSLPLHTSERAFLLSYRIKIKALSHLLNPKWNGWGKVPFWGCSREQIQWRRGGACSSEGLEHVATNHGVGGSSPSSPKAFKGKALDFPSGGRKVMIGIADAELLNLGMVFCWNGQVLIAEQVQVLIISSIAKMRSSLLN